MSEHARKWIGKWAHRCTSAPCAGERAKGLWIFWAVCPQVHPHVHFRAWSALGAPDVVTWRDGLLVTGCLSTRDVTWRDVTRRPPCPRRRLTPWRPDVTWRHPCPRRRLWCPNVTWRDVTASLSTAAPVTSWRDVTWRDGLLVHSGACDVLTWRDVTWRSLSTAAPACDVLTWRDGL